MCIYDRDIPNCVANRDKNVTDSVTKGGQQVSRNRVSQQNVTRFSDTILAWIRGTSGWWRTDELDRDLGISDTRSKDNRRQILFRLKAQGVIEQHPKINKQWRYVNKRVTSLDFKTASISGILHVKWPLGIEKKVNLFPGNVVVAAGSPNAGKTALLLNFIYLNQHAFPIYYFCSEMGAVELRNRLEQFPGMAIEDWKFNAIERRGDFADVIVADCINIVDYLEMTTELYEVNTHLTAISHKIGSGLAIVALQKKSGSSVWAGPRVWFRETKALPQPRSGHSENS